MLDRAEGLGDFAEIETLAATESDLPAAQAAVLARWPGARPDGSRTQVIPSDGAGGHSISHG